jgi:hypothetical protein
MPPAFKTEERYIPKLVLRAMEITDIYITVTPTTGLSVHSEEVAKLRLGKKMRTFLFGWHGGGVLDAVGRSAPIILRSFINFQGKWRKFLQMVNLYT